MVCAYACAIVRYSHAVLHYHVHALLLLCMVHIYHQCQWVPMHYNQG